MRILSITKYCDVLRQLIGEYLFVLLCSILVTIGPTNANQAIAQDSRGLFQCPDLFGHYPDLSDCSKYYVCDHGQTLEHKCNNGLVFNTELKTCDWRRNVECDTTSGSRGDHSTRNGYQRMSDPALSAPPEPDVDYPESISDNEYNKYPEYTDDQQKDDLPPPMPTPRPTPRPTLPPYRLPPPQRQSLPLPRRPLPSTLPPQSFNPRYGSNAANDDEDDSPGVKIFDDQTNDNNQNKNRFQAPNPVSNGFRPIPPPINNNRLQNNHVYRPPPPTPTVRVNHDITRIPTHNYTPKSHINQPHEEETNGTDPNEHHHEHSHDYEHTHDHDQDHEPEHDHDYDYAHYDDYEEPPDYHETHEDEPPPHNQINIPPPQPTPQYKTSRPLQITISRRPSVPITRSPKPQNPNSGGVNVNARNAPNSNPNAKRSPAVKRTGWLPNDADKAEMDEFHWSMGDAENFAHEKPNVPEEAFVKLNDFKKIQEEINRYNKPPDDSNSNNNRVANDQPSDGPPQSYDGNSDYKYTYGGIDSSHHQPKRVFTLNTGTNPKPQTRSLLRNPEDNVSSNFASGLKPTPVHMVNSHPVRPTGFAPRYNSKRQVHTVRPMHSRNHNQDHRSIHSRIKHKLNSRPPMLNNSVRQSPNPFRGTFVKSVPRNKPLMRVMPNRLPIRNHPRINNNSEPIIMNVNTNVETTTPSMHQIMNNYQKDLPDAVLRTRKFSEEFRDAILDNYMNNPKPAYILDDGDFGGNRPRIPMIEGENGEEEEEEDGGAGRDEIRDIEKDIADLHAKKQSTDKSKTKNNNNKTSTTSRTTKVPDNNTDRSTTKKKNTRGRRRNSKSRSNSSDSKKLVKPSANKESIASVNTTFTLPNQVTDSVDKNYNPIPVSVPDSNSKPVTVSLNANANDKPVSRYLNTDAIVKQQRLQDSHTTRSQPPVITISVQSTTQKTTKKPNRNRTTVRPRSTKLRNKDNINNNDNNNATNKPPKKRQNSPQPSKPKITIRTSKQTPTTAITTTQKPITIPKPKLKVHINLPTRPQSQENISYAKPKWAEELSLNNDKQQQERSRTSSKPNTWDEAITKNQGIYDNDNASSLAAKNMRNKETTKVVDIYESDKSSSPAWNKLTTNNQIDKGLTKDFYLEEKTQTPSKPNSWKQIVTENGDEIYDDERSTPKKVTENIFDDEEEKYSSPPAHSTPFKSSAKNLNFDETERPQLSPKPSAWTKEVPNNANEKSSSQSVENNWNKAVTKSQDIFENERTPNIPKPNTWNKVVPKNTDLEEDDRTRISPKPWNQPSQPQPPNKNSFILSAPEEVELVKEERQRIVPKVISWNTFGVANSGQQRKPDVTQNSPKPNARNQEVPKNIDSREQNRPWNVPQQIPWDREAPKVIELKKEEKPQLSPKPDTWKQEVAKNNNDQQNTRSPQKTSWNSEEQPVYDYYEYDKTPANNQNKNTNTNKKNRNNGQTSSRAIGRPNSHPIAYQKAEKCFDDICIEPDCRCGGIYIPGGLSTNQVPQIVLLTFDDSVNDLNWDIYEELFSSGRTNPNGCPILGTFYVSHEWTDYGQIQTLYSRGHEFASHSITHSFGEKFSKEKWLKEIHGQRELMHLYGGVKMEDVRGMRAPFLQTGGNTMFEMLYDANFTYDSSLPVYDIDPPYYPYTLDYSINHECMITPCPTNSYPGLWEVGMVMWQDLRGGRCSMADACFNPKDEQGVYDMLKNNFNRHYNSNRAPFGIFYHSRWFLTEHNRKGFIKFLDEILAMGDTYLVTNWQMIQWMKDPTPLSRIKNFAPWKCESSDRPPECRRAHECKVKKSSETRSFRTCQSCPNTYPWYGNNGRNTQKA